MADTNFGQFTEITTKTGAMIIYVGVPSGGGHTDGYMQLVNLLLGLQETDEKGVANGYASLDNTGKVPLDQLSDSILIYKGTWDANTNSPTLSNTDTGVTSFWYRCNVAGTVDFGAGDIEFDVGDKVVNNGTLWEKWDTTDSEITADEVIETDTRKFLTTLAQSIVGAKTFDSLATFNAHALGSQPVVNETASFSVSNTHKNRLVKLDVSSLVSITLNATTNTDFAIGDRMQLVWATDSATNTVALAASGVTIISKDDAIQLAAVGVGISVVKIADGIFWAVGGLE